jgi:type I restriction enzyme M protein
VAMDEVQKHNFVMTPGRYVGIPDELDDGIPFEEKMKELTTQLKSQMDEEKRLDEEIKQQLANIGFSL